MTEMLSIPRTTSRGVVGDRQLVAVQTFDIARLTNHAVPLIPGTFIAVSGQGPKGDSNGSGKTSFLAAVSILMGDPQWRLESNGGKFAAGVLFRPDSAGVDPAHQINSASSGYIAGVFALADGSPDAAITVWVRLSTSAPYVQARWGAGRHAADAELDGDRYLQADEIWQRLKDNGTLSARRMAEVLYGDAPRCLSYLDTPLRPAAASLLSQQMTEMAPRDIGDSLIALSGSKAHIDEEREQRGSVLSYRRNRDESLTRGAELHAQEQIDLDAIAGRDAARTELEAARCDWRLYTARRYLAVLRQDGEYADDILDLEQRSEEEADRAEGLERELADLEKRTDLDADEDRARIARDRARSHNSALVRQRTEKDTVRAALDAESVILTPQLDGWDGRSTGDCELDLAQARTACAEIGLLLKNAHSAVDSARAEVALAELGRSGDAGVVVDALRAENIGGAALFDVVELADEVRPEWEPRLWPWRDAVIVDGEVQQDARRAVAHIPGAHLIYTDGADGVNYAGVTCPLPITGFFRTLEQRFAPGTNPAHVIDSALPASINGSFAEALTGREALLATMRGRLDAAEAERDRLKATAELCSAALHIAETHHTAAVAADRLKVVRAELGRLAEEIGTLDHRIGDALASEKQREAEWETAFGLLKGYRSEIEVRRTRAAAQREKSTKLQQQLNTRRKERENLLVERWRAIWGGNQQQAVELVAAEPVNNLLHVERMRVLAVEHLARATMLSGIGESNPDELPSDFREAAERRQILAADISGRPPAIGLAEIAAPLSTRLDGRASDDRVRSTRIEQQRAERASIHQDLESRVAESQLRLQVVQDMIAQRIEGVLKRVSAAFNRLDEDRGGCGADLVFDNARPDGPGEWLWQVTPRWRRSLRGQFVSYREIANGAQVKVYAVQLVLAALLADADTRGRVLVLDELGNSLGEVNRKDVLTALERVAEQQEVTILGTCQDSVLADAADVCGELMWFSHTSTSNAYNHPTRVWAFDSKTDRANLIADWMRAGRQDD